MLIEFTVGNYRSFKEKVTFSMVAADITSSNPELDEQNVFAVDDNLKLLKSAAIYGANASGKSNLAQALYFMGWFIINSSIATQSTNKIGIEQFKLSTETEKQPSFFEIVFILDSKRYRYGFEVNQEKVIKEWLFCIPKVRETTLFERENSKIKASKKYKADGIASKTRDNALFLSVSAQFNVKIAIDILAWFDQQVKVVSGLDDSDYEGYTLHCLINQEKQLEIKNLIQKLDLGFHDFLLEKLELSTNSIPKDIPEEIKKAIIKNGSITGFSLQTIHQKFDSQGNPVELELFDLEENESEGTQKVFALAAPLVDTLQESKVLVIDEFDARLHPLISRMIIKLFNSKETNPNNAQLIVMTHDTNLLSNKLLRRDQIWFTEKNRYGATDLYSLVEYKMENDASLEQDYIKGRYGAIPYISNLSSLWESDG